MAKLAKSLKGGSKYVNTRDTEYEARRPGLEA